MAMDAIVATDDNGGRVIAVIYREAVEINYFSYLLYNFILNPSTATSSNLLQRGSRGWGVFIHGNHAARRENGSLWWGCLCDVYSLAKSLSSGIFLFPPERCQAIAMLDL